MLGGLSLQSLWGQWWKRGASGSGGFIALGHSSCTQGNCPISPQQGDRPGGTTCWARLPHCPSFLCCTSECRNCGMHLGVPVWNKAAGYCMPSNLPQWFSHASADWLWSGICLTLTEHQSCHWITVPVICRSLHKCFLKTSPRLELLQELVLCFHFNSIWSTGQEMGKTHQYGTPHNSNYEELLIFTKLFELSYLLNVALGTHLQKCQFIKATMYISSSELFTLLDTINLFSSWGLKLGRMNCITKVSFSFCSQWLTSVQRTLF